MLNIQDKRSFRKDYKKLKSSGKDLSKLAVVIDALASGEPLAEHYRDHLLIGDYAEHRECHISPDWLLIYQTTETELILVRMACCLVNLSLAAFTCIHRSTTNGATGVHKSNFQVRPSRRADASGRPLFL